MNEELEKHITTVRRLKAFHEGSARDAMEELYTYLSTLNTALTNLEIVAAKLEAMQEEKH